MRRTAVEILPALVPEGPPEYASRAELRAARKSNTSRWKIGDTMASVIRNALNAMTLEGPAFPENFPTSGVEIRWRGRTRRRRGRLIRGKPADKSGLNVSLMPVDKNLDVIRGAEARNLGKPLRLAEYKRLVSQAQTVAGLNRRWGDAHDPRIDLLLGLKDSSLLKA